MHIKAGAPDQGLLELYIYIYSEMNIWIVAWNLYHLEELKTNKIKQNDKYL